MGALVQRRSENVDGRNGRGRSTQLTVTAPRPTAGTAKSTRVSEAGHGQGKGLAARATLEESPVRMGRDGDPLIVAVSEDRLPRPDRHSHDYGGRLGNAVHAGRAKA